MTEPTQTALPIEQPPPLRRRRKRGADRRVSAASLLTFEEIKGKRSKVYLPTLAYLNAFPDGCEAESLPTAREILREMKARGVLPIEAERNSVSPRLTELLEAGCVDNPTVFEYDEETGEQIERIYLKQVAGDASASVWRITSHGRLFLEHLKQNRLKGVTRDNDRPGFACLNEQP